MDKIAHINEVLQSYFDLNKSVSIIPAKDLMPHFIQAGIFPKDSKKGLLIRNILRQLDKVKQLSAIPFVIAERKEKNTNWFFCRTGAEVLPAKTITTKNTSKIVNSESARKDSDEHYIIDLCDELFGLKASRQHRFPFLVGDSGRPLPVDAYYASHYLVIEYNEQQHTKSVSHFDKPNQLTVSGVHRGEQRKIYDKRKREVLPQHGIAVIDIPYTAFNYDSKGKILRDRISDLQIVKRYIKKK